MVVVELISDCSELLRCEEYACFVEEEVEMGGGELACLVGVELICAFVEPDEVLCFSLEELVADLVVDSFEFVFPIHQL